MGQHHPRLFPARDVVLRSALTLSQCPEETWPTINSQFLRISTQTYSSFSEKPCVCHKTTELCAKAHSATKSFQHSLKKKIKKRQEVDRKTCTNTKFPVRVWTLNSKSGHHGNWKLMWSLWRSLTTYETFYNVFINSHYAADPWVDHWVRGNWIKTLSAFTLVLIHFHVHKINYGGCRLTFLLSPL